MRISDWSSDVCSSDLLVCGVDTAAQVLRIEVEAGAGDGIESRVEHADDLRRLVADDGPAQLVPQHRHGDAPAVVGLCRGIDLVQLRGAVHAVGNRSRSGFEGPAFRSEEHTSELQSLMRISYAVFCLKKKNTTTSPLVS